jgi:DNA processing protein
MSRLHWVALSLTPGIGGKTMRRLLKRFGDAEAVFGAPDEALLAVPRIGEKTLRAIRAVRLEQVEAELLSLEDEGIGVLVWDDEDYPANLRTAADAPPLLFVCGTILPEDARAVAIVGTRTPSSKGLENAHITAVALVARGLTVVSGLALGVDTAAHTGALRAGGRTLAVLGSGLRVIHPRSNAELAEQITVSGALLSELHPNTPVRGFQLMARDRIVSGLSRAIVVVEARLESGSLDTAQRAREQGRPLFAIPGSPGCDALLQAGAHLLVPDETGWDEIVKTVVEWQPQPAAISATHQPNLWFDS